MTTHFQHQVQTNTSQIIIVPFVQNSDGELGADSLQHLVKLSGLKTEQLLHCFSAKHKEVLPLPGPNATLLLLGLGADATFGKALQAFIQLASKHQQLLQAEVQLYLLHLSAQSDLEADICEAAVNGLWQGSYQIGKYKTANGDDPVVHQSDFVLTIISSRKDTKGLEGRCERGRIIAQAQTEIMALVNAPANHKYPQKLADWAQASAKRYGYSATVWDKKQITEAGMHGLLAVNQGSPDPPVFIVLEYRGESEGQLPKIGLVGKGVTFDTGGLSLKPSTNMHYMKSDMGGAAAVLGTMETVARLKLPIHLVAAIPSTDNAVDAQAVKPSDVISSYSGKTIEIIDTDAEGRLILADGLSYIIRQHEPQVVIDLATLTGSSVRTFGYQASALFSKDDQLVHHLEQAGRESGERVWRLPLWDEYGDDMKSDVADIKNFSGRPVAGAITAAKFLEFFTEEHPSWAHLDIAGTAFGDTTYGKGKAATGYGVRLLTHFLQSIIIPS